ncbi:major facilitator super transporter protein [Arachnomyces sp. PD_36]|nr:major facilitator super transporter protein [Arachnomyces sp. PD_36]
MIIANLLIPISVLVFSTGFFPYKPFIAGLATFDESQNGVKPPAIFDKVVFMVVDALRSDFVYGENSGFEFTQSLIRSGAALPFTAHASSPTITMPRVKAITTGSVPSFLDVILNFAESDTSSTLSQQDTWLSQIHSRGGKLVMYGDDTWLKLFPGMFERDDGTTSFFVSDFVEVDNNVTRHLPEELQMDDWSAMVMHYLGLDHIGHKAGPKSPHMTPKQQEMDSVVRDIYIAMQNQQHLGSTLLILCGDHGMNEAAFVMKESLVPQTCRFTEVSCSERLGILLENSRQILSVVKATFPDFKLSEQPLTDSEICVAATTVAALECDWQAALRLVHKAYEESELSLEAESALLLVSRKAQQIMSSAASNYDLPRLIIGSVLAGIAVGSSVIVSFAPISQSPTSGAFFIFTVVSYGIMMFASSYVEEEQQFWYWIFSGWIVYLHLKAAGSAFSKTVYQGIGPMALLIAFRITRRWNQTGQKFAAEPDIATDFLTRNVHILWVLVFVTYADVYQRISKNAPALTGESSAIWRVASTLLCVFAFAFKLAFTQADSPELLSSFPLVEYSANIAGNICLLYQARIVFVGVGIMICWLVYSTAYGSRITGNRDGNGGLLAMHEILTLFLITQSRTENIPLFLLFRVQEHAITSMDLSNTEITITSLLLEYTAFFAFGGSNAISSVDLSSAYNGIGGYNVIAVGVLTFVGNWAGSICPRPADTVIAVT